MSIGSITPTASVLAALGTAQATGSPGAAGSDPGLFTALLKSELQTVAGELQAASGATAGTSHAEVALAPAAAPTSGAGGAGPDVPASATPGEGPAQVPPPASSTAAANAPAPAAPAPSAPSSAPAASAASAATVTGAAAPTAPPPATPQAHHLYVVTYLHGATPVSTGPTPAPLVKGPTGRLVLTAKTTGLTQLTPRFTGTVAHPTAAAEATPSVVASIAYLKVHGQA